MSATFIINGETTSVYPSMPQAIQFGENSEYINFHLLDGTNDVLYMAKETEQITLAGFDDSSATAKMASLETIVNNGEIVTISGFNNDHIDTTFVISDYEYTVNAGEYGVVNWSITLEKT